jgi:hypothetical protein
MVGDYFQWSMFIPELFSIRIENLAIPTIPNNRGIPIVYLWKNVSDPT